MCVCCLRQSLGISGWLVSTLSSLGIRSPTPIQTAALPRVLAGRDLIGKAKTGSGKTAAFALPILQYLAKDPYGICALVLTPTRELAFQIAEQFRALGAQMGLRDVVVVGGLDMLPQALQLSKRPHVVIATPGRFADHLRSNTQMHLSHCRFLVLDEVDRLMEPKFRKDLATICDALPPPEKRQTLLFSATLTKEEVLSGSNQFGLRDSNTDFVQVMADDDALVSQLDQRYLFMPQNIKEVYLVYLLSKSSFAGSSCIVFVATCRGCEVVAQLLLEMGIQCESLHSRKNQSRRLASLGKFRSGQSKVLVATDVASRGLDIPTVQLVLNYDLPRVSADYIHRVGRTARAGRGGAAITFVSQYDIEAFKTIEDGVLGRRKESEAEQVDDEEEGEDAEEKEEEEAEKDDAEEAADAEEEAAADGADSSSSGRKQMSLYEVDEAAVLELLNKVNAAKRMAKIRLEDFQLTSKVVKRRKKHSGEEEDEDDAAEVPAAAAAAAAAPAAKRQKSAVSAAPSKAAAGSQKKATQQLRG